LSWWMVDTAAFCTNRFRVVTSALYSLDSALRLVVRPNTRLVVRPVVSVNATTVNASSIVVHTRLVVRPNTRLVVRPVVSVIANTVNAASIVVHTRLIVRDNTLLVMRPVVSVSAPLHLFCREIASTRNHAADAKVYYSWA
jgi:hypothetical protein